MNINTVETEPKSEVALDALEKQFTAEPSRPLTSLESEALLLAVASKDYETGGRHQVGTGNYLGTVAGYRVASFLSRAIPTARTPSNPPSVADRWSTNSDRWQSNIDAAAKYVIAEDLALPESEFPTADFQYPLAEGNSLNKLQMRAANLAIKALQERDTLPDDAPSKGVKPVETLYTDLVKVLGDTAPLSNRTGTRSEHKSNGQAGK